MDLLGGRAYNRLVHKSPGNAVRPGLGIAQRRQLWADVLGGSGSHLQLITPAAFLNRGLVTRFPYIPHVHSVFPSSFPCGRPGTVKMLAQRETHNKIFFAYIPPTCSESQRIRGTLEVSGLSFRLPGAQSQESKCLYDICLYIYMCNFFSFLLSHCVMLG